jgi:hypothetical protein
MATKEEGGMDRVRFRKSQRPDRQSPRFWVSSRGGGILTQSVDLREKETLGLERFLQIDGLASDLQVFVLVDYNQFAVEDLVT